MQWDRILACVFDPSHMILQGMNVWKPVVDFADRIFHIHFKESQIDQEKVEEYGRFSYPGLWHTPKNSWLWRCGFSKIDHPAARKSDIEVLPVWNVKTVHLRVP